MEYITLIALGVGVEMVLNGEISVDEFMAYKVLATDFLNLLNMNVDDKLEVLKLMGEQEQPSEVFLHNMKAILIDKDIERIETIKCTINEQEKNE